MDLGNRVRAACTSAARGARSPAVGAALLAALALLPGGASAQPPLKPAKLPPVPASISRVPVVDNPYFVRDAEDPRVLHPAPGFAERGFDRGYFETMARPPIPAAVFDALEAAGADTTSGVPKRPEFVPPPTLAASVEGNILVIEGFDQLVPNTENGLSFNHGGGLEYIIQQVWGRLGDRFDFITVFTTFDDANVAAYYLPLQQDVVGLGDCSPQTSETFGCIFNQFQDDAVNLQGFVFMNSINSWQQWDYGYDGYVHDLADPEASIYAVLGQEIAHRWVSGLRFVDPRTGAVSKRLLGRDNSHWAAWVDTQASVLDGWDWDVDGDQFVLVNDMANFSTLDLYAMGALPVAAAKPFFFIDDARFVPISGFVGNQPIPADAVLQIPSVELLGNYGYELRATGEKVDVTIQDIVDAEGNRCPDPDHTQKTFRQAVVLVTRPGQSIAAAQGVVDDLEVVMATWEQWWKDKTGRALTLCTNVDEDCVHAEAFLGGSGVEAEGGFLNPGDAADITVTAGARDDVVKNAVAVVELTGNGAEHANIAEDEIPLGDIAPGAEVDVPIRLRTLSDYTCGYSTIVKVSLKSDNAATVTEHYRIFPGYKELFAATFDEGDDGFEVNVDGKDDTAAGAMVRTDVALSCEMTRRTPERDASPGGHGAFVTGEADELEGTTSLWSPAVPLDGAVDPEVRFVYWLDGEEGDELRVALSEDDKTYVQATTFSDSAHEWRVGLVRVKDAFEGRVPKRLFVRFEMKGSGALEGGIDEVRVLDVAGSCAPSPFACGCEVAGGGAGEALPAGLAVLGLLGLAARRRRR